MIYNNKFFFFDSLAKKSVEQQALTRHPTTQTGNRTKQCTSVSGQKTEIITATFCKYHDSNCKMPQVEQSLNTRKWWGWGW